MDYSRPWTETKTKAAAGAVVVAGTLGYGTEMLLYHLFDIEKVGLLVGAVAAALTWDALGGVDKETPLNGGYDSKLIADKPSRLQAVLDFLNEPRQQTIDKMKVTSEAATVTASDGLHPQTMDMVLKVHDASYVEALRTKCASTDRPIRLNPTYSRTLVDQYSFDAALAAASSWMVAVDNATHDNDETLSAPLTFCLTRPPSHHACRAKGMGGCLLNSVAIAAFYALESGQAKRVGILDVDAHHGNGIAHCVQDEPRISFVSIHEEVPKDGSSIFNSRERKEDDPRSSTDDDRGPLGNIRNLNLAPRSGWTEYQPNAQEALTFLRKDCDLLLVAAGFDAMEADWSSSLRLRCEDYACLGRMIQDAFGTRVVMGLEGGYARQAMPEAMKNLVEAWVD